MHYVNESAELYYIDLNKNVALARSCQVLGSVESKPCFSLDGRFLIYVINKNLWLLDIALHKKTLLKTDFSAAYTFCKLEIKLN